MRRVKYTLGIIHWAHIESRCSCMASFTGVSDAEEYKSVLYTVLYRATIRKVEANQADTISKVANPGKFKDKRTWIE